MIRSVRARLTLAVALVVGALAVGAAVAAPRAVRNALVDDRLDAEAAHEADAFAPTFTLVSSTTGRRLGPAELTMLFGPEIVAMTDSLADSGVLGRLRSFDAQNRVTVLPVAGVVATVGADGTIRVDETTSDGPSGPLVTFDRLRELTATFATPSDPPPWMVLGHDDISFEEFVDELDRRFGTDVGSRLDTGVFGDVPAVATGELELPRSLFDVLRDEFGTGPSIETGPPPSVDDHLFATRRVDGVDVIVSASADGIDRSVDRVRSALWVAVPFAMLLAGGVTWLLAGRALRPVRAITEQTRRIRSSTLHERVPVPGADDEIGALANEMNTMLARVQREDERRRQFVADASHELRSPIAAIRTQAEASLATADGGASDLAAGVLAEAERMGLLVDDLLSLARHDEELAPPGVVLDLDDLVLAEARRPRRVPVDVTGVSAGRVRGRPDELARVVTHLLDNAARHAARRVAVRLDSTDSTVTLTVDDDGPGIPPDQRERVFERFVRLDEARHRDSGGAGLGLAVVAGVVGASGGTVTVEDGELGGARFSVALPAAS